MLIGLDVTHPRPTDKQIFSHVYYFFIGKILKFKSIVDYARIILAI